MLLYFFGTIKFFLWVTKEVFYDRHDFLGDSTFLFGIYFSIYFLFGSGLSLGSFSFFLFWDKQGWSFLSFFLFGKEKKLLDNTLFYF